MHMVVQYCTRNVFTFLILGDAGAQGKHQFVSG